ncbi:MAG: fluoride efflux transporter CrcB [Candidatus Rokuibacteriota bacterium]|nr:MAG: fluoride efflux transporter CrcB [Candidatus Rokubacteria bacterium]
MRKRTRERRSPDVRLVLICVGGALGTGLRYLISGAMVQWLGPGFPYGTLAVNVLGSFITGVIQEVGTTSLLIPDTTRLFLTVGMMGGLTTYSTFSYETVRLMEGDAWRQAWINLILTSTFCLTVCFLGIAAGRWLVGLKGGT